MLTFLGRLEQVHNTGLAYLLTVVIMLRGLEGVVIQVEAARGY